MRDYLMADIEFRITKSLEKGEDYEYITIIDGRIIHDDELGEPVVIGELVAKRIEAGRMLNDGCWDPVFVADVLDDEFCRVAGDIFGYGPRDRPQNGSGDGWSTKFSEAFDSPPMGDLLYIANIKIDPEYRGKGIGLRAVARCIETFADMTTAVICMPRPTNLEEDESGKVIDQRALRAGKEKLGSYWTRLGFEQLPESDLYAMHMMFSQPNLQEAFPD